MTAVLTLPSWLGLAGMVAAVVLGVVAQWGRWRDRNRRRLGGIGEPDMGATSPAGLVCWFRGYHRPARFLATYQPHVWERRCRTCRASWYSTKPELP